MIHHNRENIIIYRKIVAGGNECFLLVVSQKKTARFIGLVLYAIGTYDTYGDLVLLVTLKVKRAKNDYPEKLFIFIT